MALSEVNNDRGELRILENLDELRTDLADYIAELSEAAVKERGFLVGNRKLCEAPYNKTVDWAKWYIFWADERVVAKNHSDSNYKLAKDGLLSQVPIVPSHVHSINDSVSAEEAADEYMFVIRQLVKTRMVSVSDISDCPKFDLILLGMGPDGHIASLFPNHSALDETDEWRITFSLPVINSASNVAMVVTGESKAEAVHLAIDNIGPDCPSLPARLVQPTKGKLVWFLDKPAASKLVGRQFSEVSKPVDPCPRLVPVPFSFILWKFGIHFVRERKQIKVGVLMQKVLCLYDLRADWSETLKASPLRLFHC
ncbi:hypothetical protein CXB51_005698 [Gossypium anomalum]|uniref:Probable 6-phosphogluconolactonase n=1 Tax=Gossypium anomalum TaxID=47600 RepID=A0A8J5ZFF6_9ROSI|nr:hypothetical protein CXB51_005698 [Gossypium anomalum]